MKNIFVYLIVCMSFLSKNTFAEDEMDVMLFAPAPKITAAKPVAKKRTSNTIIAPAEVSNSEFDDRELPLPIENRSDTRQKKADHSANNISLTEAIREESDQDEEKGGLPGPLAGTWVEKLATSSFAPPPSDLTELDNVKQKKRASPKSGLESMVEDTKNNQNRLSNASVFDISGIMLRMSLTQVEAIMTRRGFKLMSQKFEIPNFIKWRYEEQCRLAGIVGYERLASCVVKAAKDNNYQYVSGAKYIKQDTQEEIDVSFTSNFTNNKVYKVSYRSSMPRHLRGNSQRTQYLRDIKVYDFWRKINQKYGIPDNKQDVIWGMGGNKPYMKAATGFLFLEDPMLRELDYTRMSREDQKFMNTNIYNF
jgi:hypothetical protein